MDWTMEKVLTSEEQLSAAEQSNAIPAKSINSKQGRRTRGCQ
jgi:hypothetical protein